MVWYILFAISISTVILFQWALALGAPWGEYAMGGKYPGKFPVTMGIAAMIQSFILLFLLLIVTSKSKIAFVEWSVFSESAIWFVVGFSVIASVLNLITPSKKERMIWAPVCLILLISSLFIALEI